MLFLECVLTESHSSFDLGSLSPFRTTLLCKSSLSGSLSLLLSSEILSLSLTMSSCNSGCWNISLNSGRSSSLQDLWCAFSSRRLQLHGAIYRPESFVVMLCYCANLKAIRYESTSFNRNAADKSHRVIVALVLCTICRNSIPSCNSHHCSSDC